MRRFFAGLLLALALPAFAQTCPDGQMRVWTHAYSPGVDFPTGSSACSDMANKIRQNTQNMFGSAVTVSRSGGFIPTLTCRITGSNTTVSSGVTQAIAPTDIQMNSRCIVGEPEPEEPSCPSQNSEFFNGLEWSFEVPQGSTFSDLDTCAPSAPSQSSGPGCTIEYSGIITTWSDGKTYFSGTSQATSASCNYSPTPNTSNGEIEKADYPPPPPETAKPPPAGTCPGEVNGELVFAPCSFGPSTETISVTKTRNNGTDTITDTITGSNNCTASDCTWNITSTSTSTSGGSSSGSQSGTVNADGSGDGDGEGTGEQGEPCGAPGQPVCRVKVDETGTPSGQGAFKGLNQQSDGVTESTRNTVEGLKNWSIPSWSWTFQLPTGCAPLFLEAFAISLDICEYQPMIHDLMSMVWIAATISFLVALFIRTD